MEVWPSRGTNASLIAFNPKTGLVYVNSWEIPADHEVHQIRIRASAPAPPACETSFRTPPAGEPWGYHMAFNPVTGKTDMESPGDGTVISAGMLATDGGLLFTGRLNGEFIALDQATGETVVEIQDRLRDQCSADDLHPQRPAIRHGAVGRRRGAQPRHESRPTGTPTGGSVWTFALMPE